MSAELRADPVEGSVITARPHWLPLPPTNEQRTSKSNRWANFALSLFLTTLIYSVLLISLPDLRDWVMNVSSSWPLLVPCITAYVLINLYTFLAIFSPRPIVRINPWEALAGNQIQIHWEIKGWKGSIRKIQLVLVCTEHYYFQKRGPQTSSLSESHELIRIPIFETANPFEIQQGYAQVVVPQDSMHSLLISGLRHSYGFKWEIVYKGNVAFFPDFEERIEFVVLPGKIV